MNKSEAAQILGLRETALTKAKVKEAHRRMMIANHPDRGGAPYLASKINEAKVSKKASPPVKNTLLIILLHLSRTFSTKLFKDRRSPFPLPCNSSKLTNFTTCISQTLH